jgi:hypothetical protein
MGADSFMEIHTDKIIYYERSLDDDFILYKFIFRENGDYTRSFMLESDMYRRCGVFSEFPKSDDFPKMKRQIDNLSRIKMKFQTTFTNTKGFY